VSSTNKYLPNWSADGGGVKQWFLQPTGAHSIAWQRIDEGVLTPNDLDYIYCLGNDARIELEFDWTGLTTNIQEVYEFIVDLRYQGQVGALQPYMKFELWTDYPTPLARKVDEVNFGTNTGPGAFNASVSIAGISMTYNELAAAHLKIFALGSTSPPDPPPPHRT